LSPSGLSWRHRFLALVYPQYFQSVGTVRVLLARCQQPFLFRGFSPFRFPPAGAPWVDGLLIYPAATAVLYFAIRMLFQRFGEFGRAAASTVSVLPLLAMLLAQLRQHAYSSDGRACGAHGGRYYRHRRAVYPGLDDEMTMTTSLAQMTTSRRRTDARHQHLPIVATAVLSFAAMSAVAIQLSDQASWVIFTPLIAIGLIVDFGSPLARSAARRPRSLPILFLSFSSPTRSFGPAAPERIGTD